jgi:glycosyltransferase involved in cell wall biosynthesis
VVAGSEHIVGVLDDVVGPGGYRERVHVVPPGVDVDALRPRDREAALAALLRECGLDDAAGPTDDERRPDPGLADRVRAFFADDRKTVLYAGKLSAEKGVSVLLQAAAQVEARVVIAGFGPERDALEATVDPQRVLFTGALEHRHLAYLWALADASVTPSVFPEAFGMVAAEAASCGSPPLVADHSGLAEIAAALRGAYPPEHRHLTSFRSGDVPDLTDKLDQLLGLGADAWHRLSAAARATAVEQWSWTSVADRLARLAIPDSR